MNSGSIHHGSGETKASDDRDRNNKLKESNIQTIIDIGMFQEDYNPIMIQNLI